MKRSLADKAAFFLPIFQVLLLGLPLLLFFFVDLFPDPEKVSTMSDRVSTTLLSFLPHCSSGAVLLIFVLQGFCIHKYSDLEGGPTSTNGILWLRWTSKDEFDIPYGLAENYEQYKNNNARWTWRMLPSP